MRHATVTGALLCAALSPLGAQTVIGREPERSVIRDLEDGQRFGVFAGWLKTGADPVGVGGKSAPMAGIRYDLIMASPGYFTLRAFGVKSTHDVLDPNQPAATRLRGTASNNQLGADATIQIALTGERSWRGVQPLVTFGMGIIGGVFNHFDAGGYAPGVSALYSYGFALRFPTGAGGEFRADAGWMAFQVRYPNRFKTTTAADNLALRAEGTMTPMTRNTALTISWTKGVFR